MNRKIRGAVRGSAVHRLIAEELPVTSPMTSPGPTTCAPLSCVQRYVSALAAAAEPHSEPEFARSG